MSQLLNSLPHEGEVVWLGIRPVRREPILVVTQVEANTKQGLTGDHFSDKNSTTRHVTLIQAENLATIASLMHLPQVNPGLLRRNIAVNGINLLALKDKHFRIGEVLLEMTGLCHPCSRMEEVLGKGGYNAVRGHGGITARIIESGHIRLGDKVSMVLK